MKKYSTSFLAFGIFYCLIAYAEQQNYLGKIAPIPAQLQTEMLKYTWHKGCPVAIDELADVTVPYFGFDNQSHQGDLIVNKNLAPEVLAIFNELYQAQFPIEKIRPIELYQGDDEKAMTDNDTSAFNCRAMTGFPDKYSVHSFGGAIDINPLINPYTNGENVLPPAGKTYLDRSIPYQGKITQDSQAYQIFIKHGWTWGGSWTSKNIKDYQHFEKSLPRYSHI